MAARRTAKDTADGAADRLQTLGWLAAAVSHEVNNLLTPALMEIELALLNPDLRASQRQLLERIRHSIASAGEVSKSVLALARPSAERERAESCDPREAVASATACLGRGASRIKTIIDSRASAWRLPMSPVRAQHVVLNLLINSMRACPDGVISVSVGVEIDRKCSTGNMIVFTIEDHGGGVPDKVIQNLKRRARATTSETRGLGLAIVRRLVESVGGSIELRRIEPHGTRATISIPGVRAIASSEPAKRAA